MSDETATPANNGCGKPEASATGTSLSLLEKVLKNDIGSWERLVMLYRPLVDFWCRRAGLSTADAEDVAQEVFAAAAKGLGGFRRDRPGDSFRGWLHGITRNQVLLHFRRNRGEPRAEGGSGAYNRLNEHPDPIGCPSQEDESSELSRLYLRALEVVRDGFEDRTWRAFWLAAVEGRSPAELEAELQMSSAAIRQAKSRVLRRIRVELGELLE